MKKLSWSLFLIFGLLACTDDAPTGSSNTESVDTSAPAQSAGTDNITAMNGAFEPPVAAEPSAMVNTLTTNFWVWEFYVVDDKATRLANKGRWFKMSADGSYETGRWQEKTGYGSWRLLEQDGKKILQFDNIDDRQDEQWEIQGINQENDTMTWAGLSDTKTAGAILKAISLLTRPTRQQFGVAE
ncbi:MAG: hypothetical protein RIC19_16405 [Phaeodactylibacter sp.]|uniref:hypothetical protein n=1 Tax=Phaeodactylibacter sp. TaxID=1940289 RepID=UPI0032EBBEA1